MRHHVTKLPPTLSCCTLEQSRDSWTLCENARIAGPGCSAHADAEGCDGSTGTVFYIGPASLPSLKLPEPHGK